MSEKTLTIPFLSASVSTIPAVSWIELEQAEIPLDQEEAQEKDVYAMLGMSGLGQSARAYKTGRCPVTRSIRGDSVVASTRVSFYVHSSPDFEYVLHPSEGNLSDLPMKVFMHKDENIKTKYNEQFSLEWLPFAGSFTSSFTTPCYDKKRKLVPYPEVVQDSGFVYIKGAVWAVLRASGTAVCDKWSLTIEHEQGQRFARSVFVDAVWYEGEDRKFKRLELKLAGCVKDKFRECPNETDPLDPYLDGGDDGSNYWGDFSLNHSAARVVYSPCDGNVIKVYVDEDK